MLEEKNGSNENKNRKTKVTATEFSLQRKRFGQHSIEYRRRERHELSAQVSGNPSLFTSVPAKAGIDVGHGRRVRQDTSALRLPPYRGVSFPRPSSPPAQNTRHLLHSRLACPAQLRTSHSVHPALPMRQRREAESGGTGGDYLPRRGPGRRPGCSGLSSSTPSGASPRLPFLPFLPFLSFLPFQALTTMMRGAAFLGAGTSSGAFEPKSVREGREAMRRCISMSTAYS